MFLHVGPIFGSSFALSGSVSKVSAWFGCKSTSTGFFLFFLFSLMLAIVARFSILYICITPQFGSYISIWNNCIPQVWFYSSLSLDLPIVKQKNKWKRYKNYKFKNALIFLLSIMQCIGLREKPSVQSNRKRETRRRVECSSPVILTPMEPYRHET